MERDDNALGRLWDAIAANTQGDLFWIGEILLAELEKETGFAKRVNRDTIGPSVVG